VGQLWGHKRLADLYTLEGRFTKALEHLVQAVRLAGDQQEMAWKYRLHLETARIYLELNKASQAMQQCDAAWSIAVQGETMDLPRDALHYRGLCYLGMNRIRDAQRTADRLRGLCEKGPSADRMRAYYHLMGKVEMSRKNYTQAVELFQQGVKLLPPQGLPAWHSNNHTLMIDALAEAYYAADNPIKALEEFENVRDLTTGRLSFGDLYARIYYKLGKIREEYGLMDIASNVYHKFLSLWENADTNLPEIRDARKRFGNVDGR
jgi:tetratricopeptide (TPR) repeat protein